MSDQASGALRLRKPVSIDLQKVIIRSSPTSAGALAGMEAGWNQSLDRLTAFVEPPATA